MNIADFSEVAQLLLADTGYIWDAIENYEGECFEFYMKEEHSITYDKENDLWLDDGNNSIDEDKIHDDYLWDFQHDYSKIIEYLREYIDNTSDEMGTILEFAIPSMFTSSGLGNWYAKIKDKYYFFSESEYRPEYDQYDPNYDWQKDGSFNYNMCLDYIIKASEWDPVKEMRKLSSSFERAKGDHDENDDIDQWPDLFQVHPADPDSLVEIFTGKDPTTVGEKEAKALRLKVANYLSRWGFASNGEPLPTKRK